MSKRYTLSLLSQVILSRYKGASGDFRRPPSQIVRVAQVTVESLWNGSSLGRALAKLTRYKNLSEGLELVSQLVHYQLQFLESAPIKSVKPLPRKLLVAIRNWPENDEVFPKVIQALESHPSLSDRLREQATAQTEQTHLLGLKQSLLWLGPERSRELILVSHFETHLSYPYFPLREPLLVLRTFLSRVLESLLELVNVDMPCHPDLLSYLWVYDCWYHPNWTTQVHWKPLPKKSNARVKPTDWQTMPKKPNLHRAMKLAEYWRLSPRLVNFLAQPEQSSNRLAVLCQLSAMAALIMYEKGGDVPSDWQHTLSEYLSALGVSWTELNDVMHTSAHNYGLYCPFEPIPL